MNEPEPTIACSRCGVRRPPLRYPGTSCLECGQPGPDAPAIAAQAQVPWVAQLERELVALPRPVLVAILVVAGIAALALALLALLVVRGNQGRRA